MHIYKYWHKISICNVISYLVSFIQTHIFKFIFIRSNFISEEKIIEKSIRLELTLHDLKMIDYWNVLNFAQLIWLVIMSRFICASSYKHQKAVSSAQPVLLEQSFGTL